MTKQQIVTKTRAEHAALISAALVKGVEAAIEVGRCFAVARNELSRADFLAMLQEDLHISEGTASKLIAIASCFLAFVELSKWKVLPADWTTLYALTKVPPALLQSAIQGGKVFPGMTAKDVRALLPSPKPERDDDLPPEAEAAEPEEDPEEDDAVPTAKEISRFVSRLIQLDAGLARDLNRMFQHGCERDLARALKTGIKNRGNGADPDASAKLRKTHFAESDPDRWIDGDTK